MSIPGTDNKATRLVALHAGDGTILGVIAGPAAAPLASVSHAAGLTETEVDASGLLLALDHPDTPDRLAEMLLTYRVEPGHPGELVVATDC